MKYSFSITRVENDGDMAWVAESQELKNCLGVGETQEEAIAELEANEYVWLEMAAENNVPIPEPRVEKLPSYSGKLTLRLSPREHELAAKQANTFGISLNQYINDAVVAYTHESFGAAKEIHEIHQKVTRLADYDAMRKRAYLDYKPQVQDDLYRFSFADTSETKEALPC